MPLKTSEAFIIDVRRMQEADRLVVLFTEDEGKVRGVAPSAARSRRRFGGKLERLSRVRATWFEREGRDLARLDACDLLEGSFVLYEDLRRAALLAYLAEVVDTFSREREADPHYFRLLRSVIEAMRAGGSAAVLARYFEVWTLRLHGLMPPLDACAACGKSLARGAWAASAGSSDLVCGACRAPGGGAKLSPRALDLLESFRRASPAQAAASAPPGASLAEIQEMAGGWLREFVGQPFRSAGFLGEMLREEGR